MECIKQEKMSTTQEITNQHHKAIRNYNNNKFPR